MYGALVAICEWNFHWSLGDTQKNAILIRIFLLCLVSPIATPFFFEYQWRRNRSEEEHTKKNIFFDKFTKTRLEEIFEEAYHEDFWWWEAWRIMEKLIFSCLAVLIHDLLKRIFTMAVVLIFLIYFHFRLNPYKREMPFLYRLDMASFVCLVFHLVLNLIRLFVVVYGSSVTETFNFHLDSVLTPLWFLPLYFLFHKLKTKLETWTRERITRTHSTPIELNE